MKKEVLIRVNGRQYDEEDSEEIEVLTVGSCYNRKGNYYISYEEVIDNFSQPLKNTIKIYENGTKIRITKKGIIETQMVFVLNEKNQFIYHTPYGDMCIGTYVEELTSEITENRLFFSITYAMEVNYMYVAHNTLTIEVTEKK